MIVGPRGEAGAAKLGRPIWTAEGFFRPEIAATLPWGEASAPADQDCPQPVKRLYRFAGTDPAAPK